MAVGRPLSLLPPSSSPAWPRTARSPLALDVGDHRMRARTRNLSLFAARRSSLRRLL
jgi:hypothetical protein